MRVSGVNQNNPTFKARLCGDYKTVIDIAKGANMPDGAIKYYLQRLNEVVPKDNDRIFMFFRNVETGMSPYNRNELRSQVEILRERDPFGTWKLRERIYPFHHKPKDLLRMMTHGVERIVAGRQKDTKIPRIAYEDNPSWNETLSSKLETKNVADFDEKGVSITELISKI